jgi:serine protease AprX
MTTVFTPTSALRRKAVWGPKRTLIAAALVAIAFPLSASAAPKPASKQKSETPKVRVAPPSRHILRAPRAKVGQPGAFVDTSKLDSFLKNRKTTNKNSKETVDAIVTLNAGKDLPLLYRPFARRYFSLINAYEVDALPVTFLSLLEKDMSVHRVHYNHPAQSLDVLSNTAVQADILAKQYGFSGAGVGVAFVDSGFMHETTPDIANSRVQFVDFVKSGASRNDPNGHGTHVAGILGGTGTQDANEAGIAPGTSIVSLKVLDKDGKGTIGDILAALDWVSKNYVANNIRVVNMSVGAGVYESYLTDPLTLAAKALVDKGVVVVAAAGNLGTNAKGELQWGGITSPGVAPWVITACAFSTNGTLGTADDTIASFSSSGPTWIDFTAKPDVCAPGVGIVSLAAPNSTLVNFGAAQTPSWVLGPNGSYLSLSGTSMATPFVAGTVALMLQANPNLTPNLVKAIIEYTAHEQAGVSPLRQGSGFLNTLGAVQLSKFYAKAKTGAKIHIDPSWSRHIIWGNHKIGGGILDPNANAWARGVEWGAAHVKGTDDSDNIVWGTDSDGDNIVWGTDSDGDNIVWGTDDNDNIVWGTDSDGDNIVWGTDDGDNIVWGTDDTDNIVWGTDDSDNIVWGTDCGGDDCDNTVWGTDDSDNIVWGTDCGGDDCDNIVWGTDDSDNIVWGTASANDNIVWKSDDGDNIVWGTDDSDNIVWGTDDGDNIVWGTAAKNNVVWSFYRKGGK